jgi:hypothetical protein
MAECILEDNQMLDLPIVLIGDPLKRVEVGLSHGRQLRDLATSRGVDVKEHRHWTLQALETEK